MTDNMRLSEIQVRADAATPGPWRVSDPLPHGSGTPMPDVEPVAIAKTLSGLVAWRKPADAEFIAHAREDIPDLLAMVRDTESKLALAEKTIQKAREYTLKYRDESYLQKPDEASDEYWSGATDAQVSISATLYNMLDLEAKKEED